MDFGEVQITVAQGLSLEKIHPRYSEALFRLVSEQRVYLEKFLWWPHQIRTLEEATNHILGVEQENRKGIALSFFLCHEKQLIGGCGFSLQMKYTRAEIGFWIAEQAQGKGFMSQSLRTMIRFGFEDLGLHRLELKIAPENTRCLKLASKLNFKVEGRIRDALRIGNSYQDMLIHGLLKREWIAPQTHHAP